MFWSFGSFTEQIYIPISTLVSLKRDQMQSSTHRDVRVRRKNYISNYTSKKFVTMIKLYLIYDLWQNGIVGKAIPDLTYVMLEHILANLQDVFLSLFIFTFCTFPFCH